MHHRQLGVCGVETFGSGVAPDGMQAYAVNVRCLDNIDVGTLQPAPYNGKSL